MNLCNCLIAGKIDRWMLLSSFLAAISKALSSLPGVQRLEEAGEDRLPIYLCHESLLLHHVCARSGRTLLEVDIKGLVAGLLHEAEHAQQAAQRSAALDCLQVSSSAWYSYALSKYCADGQILHAPCQHACIFYGVIHTASAVCQWLLPI